MPLPLQTSSRPRGAPRAVVLGDLLLDVVVIPRLPLAPDADVPGSVCLRQGGAAGTTARWLARLGVRTTLIASVGRDAPGRALIEAMRGQSVAVRAPRPAGAPTGRTAILVSDAARSLVSDRGAADLLAADQLRPAWFEGIALLHLAGYSIVAAPLLGSAQRAAAEARRAGATVSLDMPVPDAVGEGARRSVTAAIRSIGPDILLGTPAEAQALLPGRRPEDLLDLAPTVVLKRGANGATALARSGETRLRLEVATKASPAADVTGAGDAFDAGFLAAWLASTAGEGRRVTLQKAVAAGHRVAMRHLQTPRLELRLG